MVPPRCDKYSIECKHSRALDKHRTWAVLASDADDATPPPLPRWRWVNTWMRAKALQHVRRVRVCADQVLLRRLVDIEIENAIHLERLMVRLRMREREATGRAVVALREADG